IEPLGRRLTQRFKQAPFGGEGITKPARISVLEIAKRRRLVVDGSPDIRPIENRHAEYLEKIILAGDVKVARILRLLMDVGVAGSDAVGRYGKFARGDVRLFD